ncbi:MAG: tRNA pseudouridine(13) synthase TruD [Halobacteriales archaeon]|nr:tRNA pseudouridine(13) synthase TruD [Halobacteriales archaeon]
MSDETAAYPDLGLDWYATDAPGVGGKLKTRPEDFRVVERADFPYGEEGRYAVVRAELRNYETHEFARDLSNALGASRKRVSWAGTKDKRAVTTQIFTVADVSRDEVESVSLEGASVEYLGRSHQYVSLGDLLGNDFVVRLRDADAPENADVIADEIDAFGGVPNLFGTQRFGSRRPVTHAVGERILADDFEGAVDAYVADYYEDEPERTQEARKRYAEERDPKDALDYFPEHLGYERALLHALADGKEGRETLDALPHNLRRMFVNAVQSRVFNLVLRERNDAGMRFNRAYPGDVVCFAEEADGVRVPDTSNTQRVTESNVEAINRHVERGRAFVTAPLVGSETEFGDGEQGETERRVLEKVGISRDDFDRDDEYGSEGTRRAIVVRPELSYEREGDDILFDFFLPRGSYATVVLREFTKSG